MAAEPCGRGQMVKPEDMPASHLPASTAPWNSVVTQTMPCREMQREVEEVEVGRVPPFKGTGYHLLCMYVCVVPSARFQRGRARCAWMLTNSLSPNAAVSFIQRESY